MKKEFEKFIIWYLPFSFLTATITAVLFPYLTENAMESYRDSETISGWLGFITYFGSNCHKWVAAVWLWNQKKKENGRFILWALYGFVAGIWAVAFHVALTIFDEMKNKPQATSESLEQSGANQSQVDNA
jgi:prolipoprotein diacylglyceryltransferase